MFKKIKYIVIAFTAVLFVLSFGQFVVASDDTNNQRGVADRAYMILGEHPTAGDIFFVNENSSNSQDSAVSNGGSWERPFNTIDFAIGQCTNNDGDIIYVAAGHTENLAAADAIDADVAGITIIGLGEGDDRPTLTYTGTAGEFVVGAANVTVENFRFVAGISNITMGISVEAGGDNFTLKNCEVPESGTATFDFADFIDLASGADNVTIDGLIFKQLSTTAGDLDHCIEAGTGVNKGLTIINSDIRGEFTISAIWSDTSDTLVRIENCIIVNATNGQHCIEFVTGSATGVVRDCILASDAQGTALDPGSLDVYNVLWCDNDVADDVGIPVVAGGEATQALIDIELDHLFAAENNDPADDSVLAKLVSKDATADWSDFNNTTDSLEALRDHLDGATVLGGIALDHIAVTADGTAAYPASVANESILAYMMAIDADISDYDEGAHSLEAIGTDTDSILTLVALAAQEAEVQDALQAEQLDHIAGVTTGVSADADLTTYVADGSILSHIMTKGADTSDYAASTDSLESQGEVAERCISDVVTSFINGNHDLFTVANGPIKILEIVAYVTDTIASEGNLINYNIDPTAPATDTVFGTDGTAVETNAAAIGSLLTWDGVVANDLTLTANGVALGTAAISGLIVPPGSIELAAANDGAVTGQITVYMRYIPLDTDVIVTVTP